MVQAGYDPQGGAQLQEFFFRKMEGGAEPMWLAGLFRTHPFSKERMGNVEAYIQQRYAHTRNNPRYVMNTDAFRSATTRLRQTKPAYDLYDKARELERSGQLSQAIATYQQAATALPD
jgi:predicted Zn-dependent protease